MAPVKWDEFTYSIREEGQCDPKAVLVACEHNPWEDKRGRAQEEEEKSKSHPQKQQRSWLSEDVKSHHAKEMPIVPFGRQMQQWSFVVLLIFSPYLSISGLEPECCILLLAGLQCPQRSGSSSVRAGAAGLRLNRAHTRGHCKHCCAAGKAIFHNAEKRDAAGSRPLVTLPQSRIHLFNHPV